MKSIIPGCCGITRRGFLLGAGAGLALGGPLGWLALKGWSGWHGRNPSFGGHTVEQPRAEGMPRRFPGRVIEVRHQAAVNDRNQVQPIVVGWMMKRGMEGLTGSRDVAASWRSFFQRDDVVGIKVNPVGRVRAGESGRINTTPSSISNPVVVLHVVKALKEFCGIPPRNIIIFERYADEFRRVYDKLMRSSPMDGVRWYASAHEYDDTQLAIDGQDPREHRDPHVVGYDPDQFVSMGFAPQGSDRRDDRRYRSHLSMIVTRMVNKIITVPCLKDHKSAGVTIALKNMSHGMNNNVARSHVAGIHLRDGSPTGPNQCNTFIPTAVNQAPLRQKATLHICDGLVGVYEGGPGNWNRTWGTWNRKSLFFATDPVAMDHVGWEIIDQQRMIEGFAPVAQMGRVQDRSAASREAHREAQFQVSPRLAALAATSPPYASAAALHHHYWRAAGLAEPFDRRQPEHVALAGLLHLGVFEPNRIEHRVYNLG